MTGTVMWHREIQGLYSIRFGKWRHRMWHKSLAQEDKRGTGLGTGDPTTLNSSVRLSLKHEDLELHKTSVSSHKEIISNNIYIHKLVHLDVT